MVIPRAGGRASHDLSVVGNAVGNAISCHRECPQVGDRVTQEAPAFQGLHRQLPTKPTPPHAMEQLRSRMEKRHGSSVEVSSDDRDAGTLTAATRHLLFDEAL